MKKKAIAFLLSMMVASSVVACGETDTKQVTEENTQVTAAPTEAEDNSKDETPAGQLTEEERNQILTDYTAGFEKLADKNFDMKAGYKASEGLYDEIDGPSGILYWQYPINTDILVTAKYDSEKNALTFESVDVNENGEAVVTSDVTLTDFLGISDDTKVLFSGLDTTSGQNLIMVEYRDVAYTYADGVTYNITLIQIGDDGSLTKVFDDGICGSGDEDITATLRAGFNKAINKDYSKDTFEDAFYNGNLLIEQENMPVYATIQFKSESGKLADDGDWEGASGIASKLYDNMDSDVAPFYWGKGKFVVDKSYK